MTNGPSRNGLEWRINDEAPMPEARRYSGCVVSHSFDIQTPVRLGPFVLHYLHLSKNVNIRSPSDTMASFTTQLQRAFANRPCRALSNSA
jgi:hypothetical protein